MFREFAGLLKRVSAAAGVASLVAFAGQANAASYVGSWDPAFGAAFPDLGWRGEAEFEIPDECLKVGSTPITGVYINGNPFGTNPTSCVDSGGLTIKSATVEFYNAALTLPSELLGIPIGQGVVDGGPILAELIFSQPSVTITMEVTNGALSGVIGAFLTLNTSDIPLITQWGWNDAPATFSLGFVESPLFSGNYYAQMGWVQYRECSFYGYPYRCKKFGLSDLNNNSGSSFLTFREAGLAVPEPGSLALLLPAVGMLAAFRRRKPGRAAA